MPSRHHDASHPFGGDRWPPLLLALRRAARPDRARVAAYLSLTRRPAGWAAYTEFLAVHRAWIASLDRALAAAGAAPLGPLPDAEDALVSVEPSAEPAAPGLSPPRSRAHALGYLYVFEAFRMGCAVLARRIRGLAEPFGDPNPLDESGRGRAWGELVRVLGEVPPEEHSAVIQGARDAFSDWEQRLAAALALLGLGSPSTDAHAA